MRITGYVVALALVLASDCWAAHYGPTPLMNEGLYERRDKSLMGRRNEAHEHWSQEHGYQEFEGTALTLGARWEPMSEKVQTNGQWRNRKSRRSWMMD